VKAKALFLCISLAIVPGRLLFGQVDCLASKKLVCQFPFSGSLLAQETFGKGTQPVSAAINAALPINAAVAAQLTQLPVPSAAVGIIQIKRKGSDVPVPFNNLGPILTDRPDTVGKGHVFTGFGYQHFNFNALDAFNLKSLPIAFSYTDPVGTADPHVHYGSMLNNIQFKLDQYIFLATAGLSRTTDLSIVIPVNSISLAVTSSGFTAYDFDIPTNHYSTVTPPSQATISSNGSASGIGDIIVGLKQMLLGQEHNRPAAAIGATFRFPSGDSLNYLGSGTLGGSVYGLVEYRAKFSPHGKVSYQWNDVSKVLNLSTTGQSTAIRLPGGLQYAIGTDFRAHRTLTLTADFLGSQFLNTPYFTETTFQFNPAPAAGTGVPSSYKLVSTPNNTYTTVNFSAGAKWTPLSKFPHLLLYGNALMQLNNVGLRSDVVPLVGIAYNFAKKGE
jgi:hypothetical protein